MTIQKTNRMNDLNGSIQEQEESISLSMEDDVPRTRMGKKHKTQDSINGSQEDTEE